MDRHGELSLTGGGAGNVHPQHQMGRLCDVELAARSDQKRGRSVSVEAGDQGAGWRGRQRQTCGLSRGRSGGSGHALRITGWQARNRWLIRRCGGRDFEHIPGFQIEAAVGPGLRGRNLKGVVLRG